MQINLNKANKFLVKLRNAKKVLDMQSSRRRYTLDEGLSEGLLSVDITLASLTPAIRENLETKVTSIQQQLQDILDAGQDYYRLKEALFAANQQAGISQRLSQITYLQTTKTIYEEIISSLEQANPLATVPQAVSYQELRQSLEQQEGKGSLQIKCFDLQDLKDRLQTAVNQMAQLEDEILNLNSSTTLEIELSAAGQRIVGQHG